MNRVSVIISSLTSYGRLILSFTRNTYHTVSVTVVESRTGTELKEGQEKDWRGNCLMWETGVLLFIKHPTGSLSFLGFTRDRTRCVRKIL